MHSQICIYVCAASVQEGALTPCSSGGFPAPFSQLSSRTRLTMTFQPWLYHKCHGSRRYYFGTIALFYPDGRREKISPTNPYSPSHVLWENKCRYHQPPSAWRTMKYLCQEQGPRWHDLGWDSAHKECFFLRGATGWNLSSFGVVLHLCSEPCCISSRSCAAFPHARCHAASPPGAVLHLPMPGGCQDNPCSSNTKQSARNALNRCTITFLSALMPPVSFSYFLF